MDADNIAAIGYAIAAGLFFALTVLLLSRWRNRSQSQVLAIATFSSTLWAAVVAAQSSEILSVPLLATSLEWLRSICWIIALTMVLRGLDEARRTERIAFRYVLLLPAIGLVLFALYRSRSVEPMSDILIVVGGLVLSAVLLVLAEQIYRNAPVDSRSGLKYFCLAVVGMFLYDTVMYAWSFVERAIPADAWAARGYVNALLVVPLAYSVKRTFRLSLDALLPRQILFYTFALVGIGAFLGILLAGDHFIRTYGATWADVGRIVFLVGALSVGVTLALSASVRARARVFLLKTLFRYKYDYRREWLRFIGTLSESGPEHVPTTAIRAVAQIVNSPGGIAWARQQDEESYLPVGSWRCAMPILSAVRQHSSLIRFLQDRQWIIDLNEMREHPSRYEGLDLGPPFNEQEDWWLIVPMILGSRLFGFIVLLKPRVVPSLNFEDHDLLKTVGRHVATHIDQAESDRRLAESSQFGTYNRLTAFLMHDLNNLIAQQSLVVKNAERFRGNPDFVDDAINTIKNSVARMRRLMEQLTSGSKVPTKRPTDIQQVIQSVLKRTRDRLPAPTLEDCDEDLIVQADAERLSMVFEHLIRNAQEATDEAGSIAITASKSNGIATISIEDSGCGMTQEFIRDRLFRPFDSTKGSQSMGIGAHQARDYARALGGQLDVTSTPGSGTVFNFRLPLSD
jgi:putative PEP-CTERM system histidine kinase